MENDHGVCTGLEPEFVLDWNREIIVGVVASAVTWFRRGISVKKEVGRENQELKKEVADLREQMLSTREDRIDARLAKLDEQFDRFEQEYNPEKLADRYLQHLADKVNREHKRSRSPEDTRR